MTSISADHNFKHVFLNMLIPLCGICANKTHMLKTETRDTKMYKTVVDAIDSCTGIPTLGMGG